MVVPTRGLEESTRTSLDDLKIHNLILSETIDIMVNNWRLSRLLAANGIHTLSGASQKWRWWWWYVLVMVSGRHPVKIVAVQHIKCHFTCGYIWAFGRYYDIKSQFFVYDTCTKQINFASKLKASEFSCFCLSEFFTFVSTMSVCCNVRRRMERERIGLCGVPDVWGKVNEEEHPPE